MTNPNPVAPKTDTPATQPKMVDDPVNGLARMKIVQAAKDSAKRRGMKEPNIHCVYTAGVLLLAEAESTLAAERAEKDRYRADWLKAVDHGLAQHIIKVRENTKLREELAAERASRVRADTEQFNAGMERAATLCDETERFAKDNLGSKMGHGVEQGASVCAARIRAQVAKPSVSPEQEKP